MRVVPIEPPSAVRNAHTLLNASGLRIAWMKLGGCVASAAAHWFGFCRMRAKVPTGSSHVPRPRLGSGSRAAMSFMGAWILDIDILSRIGRVCWHLGCLLMYLVFYGSCGLGRLVVGYIIYLLFEDEANMVCVLFHDINR